MASKKEKDAQPFKETYERMASPVKKLLAGVKKEDLQSPIEESSSIISSSPVSPQMPPIKPPAKTVTPRVDRVKSDPVSLTRVEIESNYTKVDNDILDRVLMVLSPSEFIIYLKLYRLSYGFKTNICRIGRGRLTKNCNLKSDKTVHIALAELEEKGFIKPVEGKGNNPNGTLYRIYLPQEVADFESLTRVKFTQVETTQVETTQVDFSENLGKNYLSSFFRIYKENKVDKKKDIKHHHQGVENTEGKRSDDDDENSHLQVVKLLYRNLTGNEWTVKDQTAYEAIAPIPIDLIEPAMAAVKNRASSRINSLNFFVKEILSAANPSEASRAQIKKRLAQIVRRIQEAYVGSNPPLTIPDLEEKVMLACEREDAPFDKHLFNDILDRQA